MFFFLVSHINFVVGVNNARMMAADGAREVSAFLYPLINCAEYIELKSIIFYDKCQAFCGCSSVMLASSRSLECVQSMKWRSPWRPVIIFCWRRRALDWVSGQSRVFCLSRQCKIASGSRVVLQCDKMILFLLFLVLSTLTHENMHSFSCHKLQQKRAAFCGTCRTRPIGRWTNNCKLRSAISGSSCLVTCN